MVIVVLAVRRGRDLVVLSVCHAVLGYIVRQWLLVGDIEGAILFYETQWKKVCVDRGARCRHRRYNWSNRVIARDNGGLSDWSTPEYVHYSSIFIASGIRIAINLRGHSR